MRAEINHNQENYKDLQSQEAIKERLRSKKKVYKNYLRAKLNGTTTQKGMNPVISQMYHIIVKKVKELITELPNKEDRVLIEFDNEKDPTDSHGLFSLITPSFFFYLECDILNNYRIEYLFHECPFEEKAQKLIDQFSVRSFSTDVVKKYDYPTFFKRCLEVQPPRFIHHL